MIQAIDYTAIAPVLIVAVAAVAVLLADAFGTPRRILGLACTGALLAVPLLRAAVTPVA